MTPRPALARVAALTALGRHAEAEAQALGVREVVRRQGAQPLLWRVNLALGRLYEAMGRADDAQAAHSEARRVIDALALALPDEALRERFLARTSALLPRAHRPSARPAGGPPRPGGLTPRECDVAGLIAAGRTNREIAEVLVLGERTIETHVSNILGKLGLPSRREVGRWAAANGLRADEAAPPG